MATEADKFWLGYKEKFFWTIISSVSGLAISPRACFLQYKPEVGFYIFCKNFTRKVGEIKSNPFVTLSLNEVTGADIPVAYTTADVSTDKAVIEKAWFDDLLKFGYTSKEDERAVVIVFTIHKAVLGKKEYVGAPYDYPKYKIDQTIQTFPLPDGPYKCAEGKAEIDAALKISPNVHLLTLAGVFVRDRIVILQKNEKIGYFFATNKNSAKYQQLVANPNVTLLHENKTENKQVVIEAASNFVCCPEAKQSAWSDALKNFGYTGPEDPNLKILRVVPRRVIVHSFSPSSPQVFQFRPPQYDYIIAKIQAQHKTGATWTLSTVEKGVPHARTMGPLYIAPFGLLSGTRETDKTKQVKENPHVAYTSFDSKGFQDLAAEGLAVVGQCDLVRYVAWDDKFKGAGYTGPDDKNLKFIYFNPTKLTFRKNLDQPEKYSVYCSGKSCEKSGESATTSSTGTCG